MQSLQKWWPQTVMVWREASSKQMGHVRALSSAASSSIAAPDPAQIKAFLHSVWQRTNAILSAEGKRKVLQNLLMMGPCAHTAAKASQPC